MEFTDTKMVSKPGSEFELTNSATEDENVAEITSLYSEPCYDNDIEVSGTVKFGVWYKDDGQTLYVRVTKAEGLATIQGKDTNPYAKINLLTAKSKPKFKRKTEILKKTTDPEYNETFKYKLPHEDLPNVTLLLNMWNWEIMGRNKFLGEFKLPLSSRDLDLSDSEDKIYTLKKHEEITAEDSMPRGRLHVALRFEFTTSESTGADQTTNSHQPRSFSLSPRSTPPPHGQDSKTAPADERRILTPGKLHIHVKGAEGLLSMKSHSHTNPFVRCYLLPNTSPGGKKKTSVARGTLDPVWEEEIVYEQVTLEELRIQRVLEVTVWDHDRRGTNCFIGGLRLGSKPHAQGEGPIWMDSAGIEVYQWKQMLGNGGEWVESWHDLRSSMTSLNTLHKAKEKRTLIVHFYANSPHGKDVEIKPFSHGQEEFQDKPQTFLPKPREMNINRKEKGDHYEISGELVMGLTYKDGNLTAEVIKATELAAVNKKKLSNPYVRLHFLPHIHSLKKTKIKKKTLNPFYNQTFQYKIPESEMRESSLYISVWSHGGVFKHNQFLGETCIHLDTYKFDEDPWERSHKLNDYSELDMIPNPNLQRSNSIYRVRFKVARNAADAPDMTAAEDEIDITATDVTATYTSTARTPHLTALTTPDVTVTTTDTDITSTGLTATSAVMGNTMTANTSTHLTDVATGTGLTASDERAADVTALELQRRDCTATDITTTDVTATAFEENTSEQGSVEEPHIEFDDEVLAHSELDTILIIPSCSEVTLPEISMEENNKESAPTPELQQTPPEHPQTPPDPQWTPSEPPRTSPELPQTSPEPSQTPPEHQQTSLEYTSSPEPQQTQPEHQKSSSVIRSFSSSSSKRWRTTPKTNPQGLSRSLSVSRRCKYHTISASTRPERSRFSYQHVIFKTGGKVEEGKIQDD